MTTPVLTAGAARDALDIRRPTVAEYAALARAELGAFLALLEQLDSGDWNKPTACTLWDVHDVVAHQAGHIQSGTGLTGMLAQVRPTVTWRYQRRGMSTLDAMNQRQVDIRRDLSPAQLIAELREGTPRSIARRQRLNPLAGSVRLPVPPVGMMPMRTLLHRIFPRDMWIHRLDIADATGKPFEMTAELDGVFVALAVEDAARLVRKRAPRLGLMLALDGPAGGRWTVGTGKDETMEVQMSVPDFMRRTSERATTEAVMKRVSSSATEDVTRRALDTLLAPY